jgi:hypothetical protein
MDDQRNPPTLQKCMALVKIYALYTFFLLPFYRGTATAANVASFKQREWGLSFGEGGDSEGGSNSDWDVEVDNYDRPG